MNKAPPIDLDGMEMAMHVFHTLTERPDPSAMDSATLNREGRIIIKNTAKMLGLICQRLVERKALSEQDIETLLDEAIH